MRLPSTADAFFAAMAEPERLTALGSAELDRVLRLARRAALLPRLAILAERAGVNGRIPEKARTLLASARPLAEHHERSIRLEVSRLTRTLAPLDLRIILLKGAAYVMAGLPSGTGRLVTDIDILVPKGTLGPVEQALDRAGWKPITLDAYDQRYYRRWMHELPPLKHETRGSVLDVHHTILPESARLHPDAALLLADAVPLEERLAVLCPEDMVLHSATHLFGDGELSGGFRDLVDLDALLRHFGAADPNFWDRLVGRSHAHGLTRPLFYALRYSRAFLGTPVPEPVVDRASGGHPPAATLRLMDTLCVRALAPLAERPGLAVRCAAWMLYVRSHWLRMPFPLLARHLAIKALRRRRTVEL